LGIWGLGHVGGEFDVAGEGHLRYRSCVKRGLKYVRCPSEDFRRFPMVDANTRAGFSMIELLAVVAILLLVFVLYWAPSTSGNREREVQKDCQTHLQKIYVAMEIYANEHAGGFPVLTGAVTSAEALDALVPRYTVDTAVFVCPGSKDRPLSAGESFRQHKISYAYYMGRRAGDGQQVLMSDEQVDTRAKAAGEYAFSATGKPPGNNHDKRGGNLLFCDGRTDATPSRLPFALMLTQGVVLLNPSGK
jgi:prepilin-type N-terminal cleavage/methylation domain-containing protein/prepilin-type processing-associated H-X9-DG protein